MILKSSLKGFSRRSSAFWQKCTRQPPRSSAANCAGFTKQQKIEKILKKLLTKGVHGVIMGAIRKANGLRAPSSGGKGEAQTPQTGQKMNICLNPFFFTGYAVYALFERGFSHKTPKPAVKGATLDKDESQTNHCRGHKQIFVFRLGRDYRSRIVH